MDRTYHGVTAGGEPVVMPGSWFIPTLKKGLLMALHGLQPWRFSMKYFEVVKYKVRPTLDPDVAYPH